MSRIEKQLERFQRQFITPSDDPVHVRQLTEKYNSRKEPFDSDIPKVRIERYIERLLPYELAFATWRKKLNDRCLPDLPNVDCLVMLLGYSWEPLLQSIVVYRPKAVVLVVTRAIHGDHDHEARCDRSDSVFKDVVGRKLVGAEYPPCVRSVTGSDVLLEKPPEFIELDGNPTVEERPLDVFSWIRHRLQDQRDDFRDLLSERCNIERDRPLGVLMDITGAKKSMVAGAYVYAAFSDTDVSYVDFDYYDPDVGLPHGYSCRITQLRNPIDVFRVRQWRQAVTHYEHYQFDAARSIFDELGRITIEQTDGRHESKASDFLFRNEEHDFSEAFTNLDIALEMYHLWENGDYHGAKAKHDMLATRVTSIPMPPLAVEKLHNHWPDDETKNDHDKLKEHTSRWSAGPESLYLNYELLLYYAFDEYEKIRRLIKYHDDFRSAFLRAHGLSETLIKSRILYWWYQDQLKVRGRDAETWYTRSKLMAEPLGKENDLAVHSAIATFLPMLKAGIVLRGGKQGATVLWHFVDDDGKPKQEQLHKYTPAKLKLADGVAPMREFYRDEREFWRTSNGSPFSALRNSAIHFCLSFSESLATKARNLTRENLKDFANERWRTSRTDSSSERTEESLDQPSAMERRDDDGALRASDLTPSAREVSEKITGSTPDWNDLAKVCGLTFLPEPRKKDTQAPPP